MTASRTALFYETGNRLRAFVRFNLTPFYLGYNFDTWDRKMRLPQPARSTLSIDDEQGRTVHREQMTAGSNGPGQVLRLHAVGGS